MQNSKKKKYELVIWLLMIATMVLYASADSDSGSIPSVVKLLFAGALWGCVVLLPKKYFSHNDIGFFANLLIKLVLLLTLIAVLHTILTPQTGPVENKWITLLGNQDCMFMLLTPCFIVLSQEQQSLLTLKHASEVFLVLGALAMLLSKFYPIYSILWFTGLLFPYMRRGFKLFFLLSLVSVFISAFMVEGTDRSIIVLSVILVLTYICVYVVKSKKVIWTLCMIMFILPIVYAVMTMLIPEFSAFQIMLEAVLRETGDETLANDTRTFLFREMAEDLTTNHSWLLGKGAVSHYYSDYFFKSTSGDGDYWVRIDVEVTFLQFLLRSGILYVVTYYTLILHAVISALKKAQSNFIISVAMVASGWVLYSCMSYLNGCNFIHLGFFLLLGCCLSSSWQKYTDSDIKRLLYK